MSFMHTFVVDHVYDRFLIRSLYDITCDGMWIYDIT